MRLLGESGKKQVSVVFHLNLNRDFEIQERCELKGIGPVPVRSALSVLEDASLKFVGNIDNKLAWFSEQQRRSTRAPLPEYIKRAIKAKAYDRCEKKDCVNTAEHVDHVTARCNRGINDLENLQALCEPDHHAKTKIDAPWTASGIYGKRKTPVRGSPRRDAA